MLTTRTDLLGFIDWPDGDASPAKCAHLGLVGLRVSRRDAPFRDPCIKRASKSSDDNHYRAKHFERG